MLRKTNKDNRFEQHLDFSVSILYCERNGKNSQRYRTAENGETAKLFYMGTAGHKINRTFSKMIRM